MTRPLTPWLRLRLGRQRVRARLEWKAADLWIGAYVARDPVPRSGTAWICLLPCLPIKVDWWLRRAALTEEEKR